MSESGGVRSGPPLGRHLAAVGLTLGLALAFVWSDSGTNFYIGSGVNVVMADVSTVLLCLILMLGPIARLVPKVRPLVPWGRELGIAMFVTAGLHLLILLIPEWDIIGFFFHSFAVLTIQVPLSDRLLLDWWAAANWVGLFALLYALVLAVTSSDWSQRLLGRGWKFLQRQTYTLFVLVWLHAAGWFLLPTWFWVLSGLAVTAQFVGYVHTIRSPRGPSPQRPPNRTRPTDSKLSLTRTVNWTAVTLLWGGLIFGSVVLSAAEHPQLVRFCDEYEQLKAEEDPITARDLRTFQLEVPEQLEEPVPSFDDRPADEWVLECEYRQAD